ncbi:hypothetical protein Pcinc_021589 [Petrolisthes cinctipes]|uniref:Uncharacterized protein n=1 Tax=Petrolisthes cinctipes TaxID=88211 RepID=A0AAE1KI75_PETCI|nr:hypothetical protein Pcinc_021589 [Petrolisthes cinctipes]
MDQETPETCPTRGREGVDEVLSEAWWVKVLLVCDRGRRSTLDDYHGHPAASHPTPSGPSADHHATAQSGRFQEKALTHSKRISTTITRHHDDHTAKSAICQTHPKSHVSFNITNIGVGRGWVWCGQFRARMRGRDKGKGWERGGYGGVVEGQMEAHLMMMSSPVSTEHVATSYFGSTPHFPTKY